MDIRVSVTMHELHEKYVLIFICFREREQNSRIGSKRVMNKDADQVDFYILYDIAGGSLLWRELSNVIKH